MNLGIYCAGGFGKEIYDVALRVNKQSPRWETIFFIDDNPLIGDEVYLSKNYSLNTVLAEFNLDKLEILIASGEPSIRVRIYDKVKSYGIKFATLIDPSAVISETAVIGEGVIITTHCIVASSSVIENNVAINVKTIIGHDITIGKHTVLSSMVNVGGACKVGCETYIGMAAQIKEGLKIGDEVIIGMGSVVHKDIENGIIAMGNPARPIQRNLEKRVFKSPL